MCNNNNNNNNHKRAKRLTPIYLTVFCIPRPKKKEREPFRRKYMCVLCTIIITPLFPTWYFVYFLWLYCRKKNSNYNPKILQRSSYHLFSLKK